MPIKWRTIVPLLKARLSHKIVFAVFISLVVIEGIILIPSVYKREGELLEQVQTVSKSKLDWLEARYPNSTGQEILGHTKSLQSKSMLRQIAGGAVYEISGQKIGEFGEAPQIVIEPTPQNFNLLNKRIGDRYDAVWLFPETNSKYIIVIRHDISAVNAEIVAYILRIAGLVFIIALFLTVTTIAVLSVTVIIPILQLREDLNTAADALTKDTPNPKFHAMSLVRHDELGDVMDSFNQMFCRIRREIEERKLAEASLKAEQEKSERLLLNILPTEIVAQLKENTGAIADRFDEVTILFADLVNFTQLSTSISPTELVGLLNQIFSEFDLLAQKYSLEKIKTIGDAYMLAGGLPTPKLDHAEAVAAMALEMQESIKQFQIEGQERFQLRIGINTGIVVAGVIGLRKFIYDMWGDAVNLASRMESQGIPDRIQVSEATYQRLKHKYAFEDRGIITVKGKGELRTYFLLGKL